MMGSSNPKICLIVPLMGSPLLDFSGLIKSIKTQTISFDEIIFLVEHGNTKLPKLGKLERFSRIVSVPIDSNIHEYLEFVVGDTTCDYVAVAEKNCILRNKELENVVTKIEESSAEVIYSDFLTALQNSENLVHVEQPEFSPERILQDCFLNSHTYIKTTSIKKALRAGKLDKSAPMHDLFLRIMQMEGTFQRIDRPLYTLSAKSLEEITLNPVSIESVKRFLKNSGSSNSARLRDEYRIEIMRPLDLETTVSVIIPTMGSSATIRGKQSILVIDAVKSLLRNTNHQATEIVIVYDTITPPSVLQTLRDLVGDRLTLVEFTETFNFSKKCNLGAVSASGDILIFLNDDVEVISPDFVETLISPLSDKSVGQVGVTMYFEDGTLQHGGHVYSHGVFMHAFLGLSENQIELNPWLNIDREVSGVTAACTAVRRNTFEEVGGFWENLPGNFNDVDFSLKLTHCGYRNLILNKLKIFHFESKTRETKLIPGELESIQKRWGYISRDPYFPSYLNRIEQQAS